jgi:excisionase family DNA binding protein
MREDRFTGWPDKRAAAATLGLSVRSVERLIKEKKLRAKHRPIPGRKPVTILDPKSVEEMKSLVLPPAPAPQNGAQLPAKLPAKVSPTDLLTLLAHPRITLDKKLFLTVKEASEYAGLPQAYLRRLIARKKLKALQARGYRIKRTDLERL